MEINPTIQIKTHKAAHMNIKDVVVGNPTHGDINSLPRPGSSSVHTTPQPEDSTSMYVYIYNYVYTRVT